MKCPVCDQENSTMLCPSCGFDGSRDYEKYPTFSRIKASPSVSALRTQRQNVPKKTTPKNDGPRSVDYQKMVSQAAKEDEHYHQSREYQLLRSLQAANEQIAELMQEKRRYEKHVESLKTELRTLTHYVYPENQTLKERILTLDKQNQKLIQESIQMEDNVHDLVTKLVNAERLYQEALERVSALEIKNEVLKDNLKQTEEYRVASSRQYGNEVIKVRKRDAEIAELKSQLETAQSRIAELEAELSKGFFSRIFNR